MKLLAKGPVNVQDAFLNQIRRDNIPVTIFLMNGVQIKGLVRSFDNFTVIVESEGRQMMIYKHALSTVVPSGSVALSSGDGPGRHRIARTMPAQRNFGGGPLH